MEIWLDTSDLEIIGKAKEMGILYGVTTNPSIVAKSRESLEDLLAKLLELQRGPVTAQVTATDCAKMVQQAEALYDFSSRLIVKIPVTSEGVKAIHALSPKNIPTMATAVFEPTQVLLAASAGATYIAPYFSSICEVDREGAEQFKEMQRILAHYKFPSKLLAASLKTPDQVRQCADMGAHAVTLNRDVFLALIESDPQVEEIYLFEASARNGAQAPDPRPMSNGRPPSCGRPAVWIGREPAEEALFTRLHTGL